MSVDYLARSERTLLIESMLQDGKLSTSEIARQNHVSRARVQAIKRRLQAPPPKPSAAHSSGTKTITVRFTPRVFAALTAACEIVNQENSDDPLTIEDYAEECVVNRLVTMGLVRQKRK